MFNNDFKLGFKFDIEKLESKQCCGNCIRCKVIMSEEEYYCSDNCGNIWGDPITDYMNPNIYDIGKECEWAKHASKSTDKTKSDLLEMINHIKNIFKQNQGYFIDFEEYTIQKCYYYNLLYIPIKPLETDEDVSKVRILDKKFKILAWKDLYKRRELEFYTSKEKAKINLKTIINKTVLDNTVNIKKLKELQNSM